MSTFDASDLETLGPVDWVIDVAANPTVLTGVGGKSSSLQLLEHNLLGMINLVEFCKRVGTGFLLKVAAADWNGRHPCGDRPPC